MSAKWEAWFKAVAGVYYNEWDKNAAQWLQELIRKGLIPDGVVDTRSIVDVDPKDLQGFTSWHFFAGIGGWPLALRMANIPDDFSVMTGSAPCQPFSVAGLQLGKDDERHLAPTWLKIIEIVKPARVFGEQVADAIGKGWLDDLFDALEREGYACGAAVLPACGVGAPHIRKRLFFGAFGLADSQSVGRQQVSAFANGGDERSGAEEQSARPTLRGGDIRLAVPACVQYDGGGPRGAGWRTKYPNSRTTYGLADTDNARPQGWTGMSECTDEQLAGPRSLESGSADPHNSFWSDADWLGCRDGKFRPVEPGTQPLAHGLPARVGRLRGYGNAIVPQVGAVFIESFLETVEMGKLLGDL